jgi:hypothetical protein
MLQHHLIKPEQQFYDAIAKCVLNIDDIDDPLTTDDILVLPLKIYTTY